MNKLSRLVLAYIVGVPLALVLGYMVATPDVASVAVIGAVFCCLAIPLVLEWHHTLLMLSWNCAFVVGFLPSQPQLWLLLALVSFGIAALNHVLGLKRFLRLSELTRPILFLLVVVVATGWARGGLGSKFLGGAGYGGKNYIYVLGAFAGYFALAAQRIPVAKAERAMKFFFLPALTFSLSNIIYLLGPAFYFLYSFIGVGGAIVQAQVDWGMNVVDRFGNFGPLGLGIFSYALARWGIRGILEWDKPWRLALVAGTIVASLYSGFRSEVLLLVMIFAVQFMLEGLWRTVWLPIFCLIGIICLVPVLMFPAKMPQAVQRSLAFLPIDINPDVRDEANSSTEWRLEMWKELLPDVPKYLLLGKGYSLDPNELNMAHLAEETGLATSSYEMAIVSGNYHSGPFSVLIPFGLPGVVAFLWVLGAGAKALYGNYRYGEARLRRVNTTLLAYFVAQSLAFIFIFGAFNSQLNVFLGILGLAASLNGGVGRKEASKARAVTSAPAMVLETA